MKAEAKVMDGTETTVYTVPGNAIGLSMDAIGVHVAIDKQTQRLYPWQQVVYVQKQEEETDKLEKPGLVVAGG